jgi:hypothetical protein
MRPSARHVPAAATHYPDLPPIGRHVQGATSGGARRAVLPMSVLLGAGVLLSDQFGRVLLVEPTYQPLMRGFPKHPIFADVPTWRFDATSPSPCFRP